MKLLVILLQSDCMPKLTYLKSKSFCGHAKTKTFKTSFIYFSRKNLK